MHAVVVGVAVDPGHKEEASAFLHSDVLPAMKDVPGIVGGYWLAPSGDGEGLAMLLFDTEQAARGVADGLPSTPRSEFASLRSVDVREVVGHV